MMSRSTRCTLAMVVALASARERGSAGRAVQGSVHRAAEESAGVEPGRASFSVRLKDEVCSYSVLGVYLMPEEVLAFEVTAEDRGTGRYEAWSEAGTLTPTGVAAWQWHAPQARGLYPLHIAQRPSGHVMTLNVFVLVPAPPGEVLNGYLIGAYPARPFRDLPAYLPPAGFIELTAANRATKVAPHFTLGQFACKQGGEAFPKYLVLRERLLLKLEAALEAVHRAGIPARTFFIMSGYRTPAYNRSLGNGPNSRHTYGDASDIFIDEDGGGQMDDLNHDGRVDERDALVLRDIIERMQELPALSSLLGGVGAYKATKAHGPYVHVDARGYAARWGVGEG